MKRILVGCCGFSTSRKKYFQTFSLVEIQQTFYQPPQECIVKKWKEEAPPGFHYSIKCWQLVTHPPTSPTYRKLKIKLKNEENYGFFKPTEEVFSAWQKTEEVAQQLNAKVIVFQCPASFRPEKDNINNMRIFFNQIKRKDYIFCWEPRGNWDESLIKEICEELNLVYCIDPFIQSSKGGEINYFRLHGKPYYNLHYKYTDKDLNQLLKFCDQKENYVLFNNLSMFDDAVQFQKLTVSV